MSRPQNKITRSNRLQGGSLATTAVNVLLPLLGKVLEKPLMDLTSFISDKVKKKMSGRGVAMPATVRIKKKSSY